MRASSWSGSSISSSSSSSAVSSVLVRTAAISEGVAVRSLVTLVEVEEAEAVEEVEDVERRMGGGLGGFAVGVTGWVTGLKKALLDFKDAFFFFIARIDSGVETDLEDFEGRLDGGEGALTRERVDMIVVRVDRLVSGGRPENCMRIEKK